MDIVRGHDLEPSTQGFESTKMQGPHYDIVFVDTPGFDIRDLSEEKVLESLSEWLQKTFKTTRPPLSGLLYFHRITDNRKDGSPLHNLGIFKELLGKASLNNIVLTTTMWDNIDEDAGSALEGQLKAGYWQSMTLRGARMGRFLGTRQSAFQLLRPFVDQANALRGVQLALQAELPQDVAIRRLRTEITLLQVAHKQQEILREIREELKISDNGGRLQTLREEYEQLKSTLSSLLDQMCRSDVRDRDTLF